MTTTRNSKRQKKKIKRMFRFHLMYNFANCFCIGVNIILSKKKKWKIHQIYWQFKIKNLNGKKVFFPKIMLKI